ncbi:alternative ribosome rescue aminoacyl-tRNA hydrolase ArfB [Comamonas sp. NLF-1-9]|uniref:alternative ribosome rescue aminoacyl-tRNA hydrolase ArfB n=1 Tax=Comamonas sp. NLF-1-9 TaxID=2853163 RepID=UPI001C4428EB|nr:alternative ribosome rescue aminoacyl-tRNA hydrolase ArfB [Comamonas sp. NLF-1-9]QXL83291.1 aminoacyl-tRNA hydrolase [Comamonas sp. NLF-1-9]
MVTTAALLEREAQITAIRAQGAGGQNVNKVSSAVHLRFDVAASALPAELKQRLLALPDARVTAEGQVLIKAQRYRTQQANRRDALARLQELVEQAARPVLPRKATRPTRASRERRLQAKRLRGAVKALRGRPRD